MPNRKSSKKKSPVVLVPATPSTPGSVPVATDDEASPPTSYAQVTARPAALVNAVVWPLSTTTSPIAGSSTQASSTANSTTTQGALIGTTSPLMPSTPVLRPVVVAQDAINIEPLELPPPATVWEGAQFLASTQTNKMGQAATSALPSSPIYVPSTTSATPTPFGGAVASIGIAQGESHSVQSYDEFWAHFSTPTITDTNLPSALQTPRVLAAQVNDMFLGTPWPFQPRPAGLVAADSENLPPSLVEDGSHAPVASRQRKRRRGLTPASSERSKKSARRKGKAKVSGESLESGMLSAPSNPWASERAAISDDDEPTPGQRPPPFSLPPSSFASTNQTPYAAFSRPASATTSFYGRLNMSASYPTPHDVSVSSQPSNPSLGRSGPQQSTRSMTSASGIPQQFRTSTARNVRGPMNANAWSNGFQFEGPPGASLLERPNHRDTTMVDESMRSEDSNREGRSRLRDLLSDPRSLDERPRPHRSSTTNDVPEDGEEVEEMRRERVISAFEWGPSSNPSLYTSNDGFSRPPLEGTHRTRHHEGPSRADCWSSRAAVPGPYLGSMGSRFTEEWDARSPRRMDHDEISSHWSSPRSLQVPHRSPLSRVHHGSHSGASHSNASTATPSNRISSLDIFDVGNDDNMPEAVRRGGMATEAENERPTPIPREGDPELHRHDPEAHLRGLSDDWVQEVWADPAGTSITLNTFNPRFTRSYGANRRTASDIRSSITHITGKSSFLVIAPDQAQHFRGRGPVEWAVTGLSREGVDRLLRRRVWSFRPITFFPRRRALDTPRWVIALEGFLEDNIANIESAVRSTFERPQVRQRIEQMLRANPEFNGIETDEAFCRIMATLRVTVFSLDNDTVVANVFLRSPTQSIRVWRCWIQELRDLTFGSYRTSIARARRLSACAGCLGVDHPSHLCPFPRMTGWNGPEAAGGMSYSVDGRECRARQAVAGSSSSDTQPMRSQRIQPSYGQGSSQAGPSRPRSTNDGPDWDETDYERGRDQRRDQRRVRRYDRNTNRNNNRYGSGPSQRGNGDGSRPSKGGREGPRKDGQR